MKNKKNKLLTISVILFTIFFILPAIAFSVINWGILPSHKLTPLVTGLVNKHIQGELVCEKIELTYLSTYPHLGLRINEGQLLSHALKNNDDPSDEYDSQADTLLRFNSATLSLRPTDYLFKNTITIGEVIIEQPYFHGYVDENGKANWDIYTGEKDTATIKEETATTLPTIDLRKVRLEKGHFIYNNYQSDSYAEIEDLFLQVTGSLINEGNTLTIESRSSSFLFNSPAYTLKNQLVLQFKTNIELLDNYHTLVLQDAEMWINKLPFNADGSFTYFPESRSVGMNIEMGFKATDLNDLIGFVPESYLKNRENIDATGSVWIDANVYGEFGEQTSPIINLCCKIEDGSLYMKDIKQGIESLEMDMDLHLNGPSPELSHITLEKLHLTGLNTHLDVEGKVTDILQSPLIEGSIIGNVDFTRLTEEFLNPDTLLLQGNMNADIRTYFALNDLTAGRYNNIKAIGNLSIDTLKAQSNPYDIDLFISNAKFNVDSAKSSSRYIAGDDLLNLALDVDSIHILYKDEINTNISQMNMTAKTSALMDTASVIPVTSHIRVKRLRTRLPDSVWVVASNTYIRGGIKPSESNKQIPQLLAGITIDTLRYFDVPARLGTILANSNISLEALPYRDAIKQRIQSMQRDTTRLLASRDSSFTRTNRTRGARSNTPTDSTSSNPFLRDWEARGSISFDQMRLFSRAFPLPMQMEKSKVKFDTNNITFSDAMFHAGKSNFKLNGDIRNIRRAMLRGGKLQGVFTVSSDYIDCNELVQAINQGMAYTEEADKQKLTSSEQEDLLTAETTSIQESVSLNEADTTNQLLVVPAFLDMSLVVDAKQIDYKNLKMTDVSGEVVLRDQSINLKKLDMLSNIGNGHLTMYYNTAAKKTQASVGFDLEMREILVEKLLDLYPAIDTLLPMLRSFEGIVDCQLAATCDIDSTSSVMLPSLQTGCHIQGKNMVLLDGETFTEISKTLMFKNKDKNQIDNISVDLAIKDNKIEIFPFLLEIDRYRVAVGGNHNLDMTFNYHVSVLKSPVPFKLGIDISGDLDNYKYKITKCRYKDIFQAAKEQDLDIAPTNLREDIRSFIRQQIVQNAPELALVERPAPEQNEHK